MKKQKRTWNAENHDRVLAQQRVRAKQSYLKHREVRIARSIASRKKNPEKYRETQRAYAKRNAARLRAKYKAYMARKARQMPSWADPKAIQRFYEQAQQLSRSHGAVHHVDHIVPLNGKIVSGLHCEANLQVLPGALNLSKGNRRWPDMP